MQDSFIRFYRWPQVPDAIGFLDQERPLMLANGPIADLIPKIGYFGKGIFKGWITGWVLKGFVANGNLLPTRTVLRSNQRRPVWRIP